MLFPTTLVGSYCQPDWLIDREKLKGQFPPRTRAKELWRIPEPFLKEAQDDATRLAIRDQERAGLDILTGELSLALRAGKHTTTSTTWYWIDESRTSALIDSPGFQEFGLRHIDPMRLARYMPDLAAHADHCRFYNCSHLHEPGCAVIAAAQTADAENPINADRYRIYTELFAELSQSRH